MDYCFAPIIRQDWAAYLRVLIDDHHKDFRCLYMNCRLIPKGHYYPEILCKLVNNINNNAFSLLLARTIFTLYK